MKYEEIMQEVRAERIQAAIDAAAEMFLEQGIDQAKMTDIAERGQLGVASLYRYFGSKQKFVVRAAARVWENIEKLYEGIYDSEHFHSLTGIRQVEELMRIFHVLLSGNPRFLRFVAEFDAYAMREGIRPIDLKDYERSVLGVKQLMQAAMEKGVADGTIRNGVDVDRYYFTVTHALMALAQKLAAGQILESDAYDGGLEELQSLIRIFLFYISA